VAVLGSGCHAQVDLLVDVGAGGDGIIRVGVGLDADAAEALPDLDRQVWVEDLRAAGWEVAGPGVEADGRTWLRARRSFATVEEATALLDQVSGPDGPFGDLEVQRRTGRFRDRARVAGDVDLTGGLGAFADEALRAELGAAAPLDDAAVEARLGRPAAEALTFRVSAVLPGDVDAGPGGRELEGAATWRLVPGERASVDATAVLWHAGALIRLAVVAAAVLGLAVVLVRWWRAGPSGPAQRSTDQAPGSTT
jgi:hypothetical protein